MTPRPQVDLISRNRRRRGIYGMYGINDKWFVGLSIDQVTADFERPWKTVGLAQDPAVKTIDAVTEHLAITAMAERRYGAPDQKLRWYWSTGLGFASPDPEDVTGPVEGGGMFDITTDAGTSIILSAQGGFRRSLGERWSFDVGLRTEYHLADWKVTDRESTNTATINDFSTYGLQLGVGVRF